MTKEPYAKDRSFVSGETVTPGRYACAECGRVVEIDRVTNLPVCTACQHDEWRSAERGESPLPS
jgi:hypothetical protein